MNYEQLCIENGVDIASSGRHYREGWINIHCPFCSGSTDYHLGYNTTENYCVCYRCGWHSLYDVVKHITGATYVGDILKHLGTNKRRRESTTVFHNKAIELPLPAIDYVTLNNKSMSYLKSRSFNPHEIVDLWRIYTAHPMLNYKGRIVIPIYFKNKIVSYQTRDYVGDTELRYITAKKEEEVIHHKHIVYGYDEAVSDTVVIVEGITDVWRLGYGAVATFGIKYTPEQVKLLSTFRNRIVLYDTTEHQAIKQGKKLANELSMYEGNTVLATLDRLCDPADLSDKEANAIMRRLKQTFI